MKDNARTVIVAADGGGTGCRAAAGTLTDGILAQASGGPGNVQSNFEGSIQNITAAIRKALDQAGLGDTPDDTITAHLGVAGAHTKGEEAKVAHAMPFGTVTASGDRETSVRGALGSEDGFVIALGTGTIIARKKNNVLATIGGWGFQLSDQASGAWLGRRLLQEVILAEDGMIEHSPLSQKVLEEKGGLAEMVDFSASAAPGDYAPLARVIIPMAKEGDLIGQRLMSEGCAYLTQALDKLEFTTGDKLVLGGGVGPHYADLLPDRLTQNLAEPSGTSLDGAFSMACLVAGTSGK